MSKKHKKITRKDKISKSELPDQFLFVKSIVGGNKWIKILPPLPVAKNEPLFARCPRCDGYWNGDYKCSCGMEFSERTTNGRLYFNMNQDYRLVWRVDHHDTVVWTRDPLQVPLKLPWLPFTITEDKLKLYLVFS